MRRAIRLYSILLLPLALFAPRGARISSPIGPQSAPATATAAPAASASIPFDIRISPNPLFVRVGGTMPLAVTYPPPAGQFTFDYLQPDIFRWDEDAPGALGVFARPGEWTAALVGTTRLYAETNALMPARVFLRTGIDATVAGAKAFAPSSGGEVVAPIGSKREAVAIYFPWFSERYVQPPARPRASEAWSALTPTIKPYDPQSEIVTEQHIRMARDAGLDGFVISWFTNRRKFDWNYDELFTPTLANFARIGPLRGFKVYIHYESHMNLLQWPNGQPVPLATAAERAQARLDAEADFAYLLGLLAPVEANPAVFVYLAEWVGMTPADWKIVVDDTRRTYPTAVFYGGTYNLAYLAAFDGLYDFAAGYFPSEYDAFASMAAAVKKYGADKKFYATVTPGYDSTLFWGPSDLLIPRGDGTYYQMTWDKALAASPDGVFVSTWNEWGESSVIEPAKQYGYKYVDMTADNVVKLKAK